MVEELKKDTKNMATSVDVAHLISTWVKGIQSSFRKTCQAYLGRVGAAIERATGRRRLEKSTRDERE